MPKDCVIETQYSPEKISITRSTRLDKVNPLSRGGVVIVIWRALASISLLAAAAPALAQKASGCYFEVVNFPNKIDFGAQIEPALNSKCASCHQPTSPDFSQHQLDLRTGHSYSSLTNVKSALDASRYRVRPFRYLESLLWSKVHCAVPDAGGPMPPAGLPLLTESEQRPIYGWIARGAPPSDLSHINAVPIQPGMSGPWADPSVQSQGFTFEIVERDTSKAEPSQLVGLWFTFNVGDAPGESEPGAQRWLMINAYYDPGDTRADGTVLLFDAGLFDDYSSSTSKVIGSASVVFRSCTEAYISYDINFDGNPNLARASTLTLRRVTPAPFCSEQERD